MHLACRACGSETWLPMLQQRCCTPTQGWQASSRSADRKRVRCAPGRTGWRLGFSAIFENHFLVAKLESLLKRGRQRKTSRSRAKTMGGKGAEDGHCEMRMVCITLATQRRFTSTWASSITRKRCRSFLWRSCMRPLCSIRGFPRIGGFCTRVECRRDRQRQAGPGTRLVLPSRRRPGEMATRMGVVELQSLPGSQIPTPPRSHVVLASELRRAKCGYADTVATPCVCATA